MGKVNVFPPQAYSSHQCGSEHPSEDYIGTWKRDVAIRIINELRRDGFKVHARGRGPRKSKGYTSRDLPCVAATHLALYIRGAEVKEVTSSELCSSEIVENGRSISRLEALKREIY